jgi:cytochrome c oxidase subunit II
VLGPRTRRALLAALPTAIAGALIAAPSAHAGLLFPESGGSPNADSIHTLYIVIFAVALVIFVAVEGLLIYSMIKFRARKGMVAAQIHGNTKLEIGWTIGAAVILVVITVVTFAMLPSIKNPKPSTVDANGNPVATSDMEFASTNQSVPKGPSMTIHIDGQQYIWAYKYPDQNGQPGLRTYYDLVVPVGETILLDITSDDVAHSWWIPKLGGKADAVPGYTNKTWFQIPVSNIPKGKSEVVYTGQCAELCGRNHADMKARVIGMRMDDYKRWYANETKNLKSAEGDIAKASQQLAAQQSGTNQ